ncbi:hypothetical protein AQUCO_01600027v1 [Aquilegia coerulea]|uniref:N-acetyltransferase domain-containing protein n=1 Tax=Aquilegia coerulea TaxID=218851 RepID=A0A2G5DQ26_AQUCA|nr:hypothetical protein AQUCO_01600027v1 [Aquilegia coerulea]
MGIPTITELTRDSKNYGNIVEEMVRIEKKVFPKHESLARSFQDELRKKNYGVLYSQIEGELVGYVMYSWPSCLLASINKLVVKDNYRRQGHGEALLRAAIEKCRTRNIERICLHVDPLRTSAVSLYQKLGFKIDVLIECYYSTDRNAYRMYLDFNDA